MSGPTPGPWKVRFTKFSDVIAENGATIAICQKLGSLTDLQANAMLIAQAPELLRIATALAGLLEGLENSNSSAEERACRLAKDARAVIAKATGGAA